MYTVWYTEGVPRRGLSNIDLPAERITVLADSCAGLPSLVGEYALPEYAGQSEKPKLSAEAVSTLGVGMRGMNERFRQFDDELKCHLPRKGQS